MKQVATFFKKLGNRIFLWYAFKLPPCKDITRKLSESMDRHPGLRERVLLSLHLQICELCRRYERQLHFLRDSVRGFSTAEESPNNTQPNSGTSLPREARERLKKSLRFTEE